jgi:hypothetical protein
MLLYNCLCGPLQWPFSQFQLLSIYYSHQHSPSFNALLFYLLLKNMYSTLKKKKKKKRKKKNLGVFCLCAYECVLVGNGVFSPQLALSLSLMRDFFNRQSTSLRIFFFFFFFFFFFYYIKKKREIQNIHGRRFITRYYNTRTE